MQGGEKLAANWGSFFFSSPKKFQKSKKNHGRSLRLCRPKERPIPTRGKRGWVPDIDDKNGSFLSKTGFHISAMPGGGRKGGGRRGGAAGKEGKKKSCCRRSDKGGGVFASSSRLREGEFGSELPSIRGGEETVLKGGEKEGMTVYSPQAFYQLMRQRVGQFPILHRQEEEKGRGRKWEKKKSKASGIGGGKEPSLYSLKRRGSVLKYLSSGEKH